MKIYIKKSMFSLAISLFLPLLLFSQTDEALRILGENNQGVVSLTAYSKDKIELGRGSGFAVIEKDLLITCYHLVSSAYEVKGKNYKGKKVTVEGIVAVDKPLDLAVLKIKGKVTPLLIGNSDTLGMGNRIFALGGNISDEITVSEGTLLNFVEYTPNKRMLKASLTVREGFSGGPLLNIEGQVVGVNVDLGKGLQFSIPINKAKPLIKKRKPVKFKNWNHEDYLETLEGAFLAGSLFAVLDEPGKAVGYLNKVIKLSPDNIEAYKHLATANTKLRNYELAINSFKKIIQLDPNDSSAYFGLGLVYQKLNRHPDALPYLEKALELDPDNTEGYYQLGTAYESNREFEKAIKAYKNYLALKPDSKWTGYIRLGTCYTELGMLEEAISSYQEALKEKPQDIKTNYSLAEVYQKARNFEKAEEMFKRLMEINPEGKKTYYGKIIKMYDTAGMFEKAVEPAEKIVELSPESEMAVYNLGIIYSKVERYEDAIKAFNQAISIKPDFDWAYYNIGLQYFKLKKFLKAVDAFKKFVEITPANADAWYNIGVGYMQSKKFEEALKPLRKSIELRPNYGLAYYNLGICYLNLKDSYSARDVYKTLINIDPGLAQKLKKYLNECIK